MGRIMVRTRTMEIAALSAMGVMAAGTASSAEKANTNGETVEEITVQATRSRLPANLESVPGSVTVLDAADLREQTQFSNDPGEVLQRTVPGMGLSSGGSYSNSFQTLRGRKPAVFFDGVPATVPLRD